MFVILQDLINIASEASFCYLQKGKDDMRCVHIFAVGLPLFRSHSVRDKLGLAAHPAHPVTNVSTDDFNANSSKL
jgi:hypothetical protein